MKVTQCGKNSFTMNKSDHAEKGAMLAWAVVSCAEQVVSFSYHC